MCSGSTADSDSVCLGSNPSSAAKRRKTPLRCLFLLIAELRPEPSSLLRKDWVRIPRAERVELARKRQAWVSSPKANTLVPSHNAFGVWDCRRQLLRPSSDGLFFFPLAAELVRSHSVPERKRRNGFAYPDRRSTSSLVRRRARVSSCLHEYPSSLPQFPTKPCNLTNFMLY